MWYIPFFLFSPLNFTLSQRPVYHCGTSLSPFISGTGVSLWYIPPFLLNKPPSSSQFKDQCDIIVHLPLSPQLTLSPSNIGTGVSLWYIPPYIHFQARHISSTTSLHVSSLTDPSCSHFSPLFNQSSKTYHSYTFFYVTFILFGWIFFIFGLPLCISGCLLT